MNVTRGGCLASIMPHGYQNHLKRAYIAAEFLIALLAITGNLLVCLAVSRNRKLRTVTNYFLVSLAVADILVGLLAIPCAVMTNLGCPLYNLPLCLVLVSVLMVLTQSSILSLLAVAAERYVAILLPFQYQRIMSPRNARLALLLTWSLALISGTVPLMDWHKQPGDSEYCIFTCVVDMTYMVYFNFFCCLLVPLAAMFIIYGHIFLTVRHQLRRIAVARGTAGTGMEDTVTQCSATEGAAGGNTDLGLGTGTGGEAKERKCKTEEGVLNGAGASGAEVGASNGTGEAVESGIEAVFTKPGFRTESAGSGSSSPRSVDARPAPPDEAKPRTRQELRKATSLFLVLFLFMVCWMPIHCINCVLLLCPKCPVPMSLTLAAILLSHANSALNPLLYAYRMRSFRHTLTAMCPQSIRPKRQ
ncbi:adenosine receptor A1-like [Centroberyx affinis]|uniref:adenosine receptor A1-like n=1 Tax=Centroberyx affinis TaxID=166261 RepID=UPI003A5BDA40